MQTRTFEPELLADILRDGMAKGQTPKLTIISRSMTPLIQIDDQVVVVPLDSAELKPGMIIVFEGNKMLVTHRYWSSFVENGTRYLITKGDRLQMYDQPRAEKDLVGQVIARERSGQRLDLLNGKGGWASAHITQLEQRLAQLHGEASRPRSTNAYAPLNQCALGAHQPSSRLKNAVLKGVRRIFLLWYRLVVSVIGIR